MNDTTQQTTQGTDGLINGEIKSENNNVPFIPQNSSRIYLNTVLFISHKQYNIA